MATHLSLPWYFMWSENYRFFVEIFKDSMKDSEIDVRPIEIPQETFDKELYQHTEDSSKHFWHGSYIKVNAVIDCLEKTQETYMIFSDIDIVVKPGVYAAMIPFMDDGVGMVYLKEGEHTNIGFMLLRVCSEVIDFWKGIRQSMMDNMDLDQTYVNKRLVAYTGSWCHFDKKELLCMNDWDHVNDQWVMMQLLCSCLGKEFNMAEKVFYMAQHKELNDYMKYVKPDILPFIYRFQEILMKQHQRAREELGV